MKPMNAMGRPTVNRSAPKPSKPSSRGWRAVSTRLNRQAFTTSRQLEYFTEKELTLQTGHGPERWPEVALKELVDNALDAAESGQSPDVEITLERRALVVRDNGPGISAGVVKRILDFSTRTSTKDFYISPMRGAQGNALKTILAMPYVLSGGAKGEIIIESRALQHVIRVNVDRIRQQPVIAHEPKKSIVKNGTVVRIAWPDSACSDGEDIKARFLQRVSDYALLNPHASFEFRCGNAHSREPATTPAWQKWKSSDPTSPHWYDAEQLRNLIAAYLANASNGDSRFVRELVSEFCGLSGSAKQKIILGETGLAGSRLSDLVKGGEVDPGVTGRLLAAMQRESREVKPQALGVIGEEHIRRKLEAAGCNANSIRYKRKVGTDEKRRPYVIEIAFGVFERDSATRRLVCGLNFSPSIGIPFRKLSGCESLDQILGEQYVTDDSPTFAVVHFATPYLRYTDRGKTAVALDGSDAVSEEDEQQ